VRNDRPQGVHHGRHAVQSFVDDAVASVPGDQRSDFAGASLKRSDVLGENVRLLLRVVLGSTARGSPKVRGSGDNSLRDLLAGTALNKTYPHAEMFVPRAGQPSRRSR
jgi:hypothetical protein